MTGGAGHGLSQNQRLRPFIFGAKDVFILGSVLMLCWTSVLPAAAAIVREPYLQQVTPNSVTVVWRTDDTGTPPVSEVQYGTVSGQAWDTWPSSATSTATVPPSNLNTMDHIVTITGLTAGTKYFYAVGTDASIVEDAGRTVNHFFVTAPTMGSATPFRAWIVGDSGENSADQIAVRNAMQAQSTAPDIFLHMGDIAYDTGTDGEFTTNHFGVYEDILRNTSSWPTLGNHDAGESPTAGFGPYYEAHFLPTGSSGTEAYYSFDYGNVHFIVLDSMSSDRSAPNPALPITMFDWLESDLASTSQEWVVAYFHHPPYTKGSHDSDDVGDSGGRLTEMREIALTVLETGGVDLVLSGHSHIYERSYLLDQAYGFGSSPNFVTPDYSTLLAQGRILDPGDGDPSGDGAYQKNPGGNSNEGAVYIVAGHGGNSVSSPFGGAHPVMVSVDEQFGSVLLDVNGTTLTVSNLRATETISDTFTIQKSPGGGFPPPIVDPVPSTELTTSTVQFTGGHTGQDSEHWLYVSSTAALTRDLHNSGRLVGTHMSTATGLPTSGTIFVEWYSKDIATGVWSKQDHTYTMNVGGGGNQAPDGVIDLPTGPQTITEGGSVTFNGTGTDPDNNLPLTHLWTFGAGSGVANSTAADPGPVVFPTAGVFTVTYTVTDALLLADPTPATVQITVNAAGGFPPPIVDPVPSTELTTSTVQFTGGHTGQDSEHWLYVSSTAALTRDLHNSGRLVGTHMSTATGLPTSGTIFVEWYSKDIATGVWSKQDHTYTMNVGGGGNQAPDGVIDLPTGPQTITEGGSVTFNGTGTDPDNNLPLTHLWTFGAGSGVANSTAADPGPVVFPTAGVFTVTYTVTDALLLADPTPATVQITVQGAPENFTAYNDLAWGAGQLDSNITTITSPIGNSGLDSTGQLVDFATGLPTPVSLTITGGTYDGVANAVQGDTPTMGDAFSTFNGIVDGLGVLSYIDSAANELVLTFSNMDPNKVYDLTFFSDRDRLLVPVDDWNRASLVTISDHDAFINTSSVATDNPNETGGVIFTGPTDISTRLPSDNNNGYVARFSNIDPGTDGDVVLTISFDAVASEEFRGKYGSALRLQESDGGGNQAPDGVIDLPTGPQTITEGGSVTFNGTGTDPDNNLPLTHLWTFGAGSGVANSTAADPGPVVFPTAGVFTVTYTVTDALLLADPTPATVQITVNAAGGFPPPIVDPVPSTELTTSTVQFTGGHTGQDSEHWLYVSSTAALTRDLHNSGRLVGTHMSTATGLPTSGTIFVEWYSKDIATGVWSKQDHTYTMNVGGGGNQAPDGVIDLPTGPQTITEGGSVTFNGTGTDPDNNLPLTHLWTFGAGSGVANSTAADPGPVVFPTAGVFTVTYTVTDALLLADPTPATVQITVNAAGGFPPPIVDPVPSTELTTSTVQFTGGHTGQDSEHWLYVSSTAALTRDLHNSGRLVGTHMSTATGLPTSGTIFVEWYSKDIATGVWSKQDHTYTMNVGG